MIIGIIGNIGSGKTTATNLFSSRLGGRAMYEPVVENPYLDDFYQDMAAHAFPLQVYFLSHRLRNAVAARQGIGEVIWQDRTVYEDRDIFARNLHQSGLMSERDWNTYLHIFETMEPHFNCPELLIYLKAEVDTLMGRIEKRGRPCEQDIAPDYLKSLNVLYDDLAMAMQARDVPLLVVDMNQTDLTQAAQAEQVLATVRQAIDQVHTKRFQVIA